MCIAALYFSCMVRCSISLKISPFQKYHVGGKVMLCGAKQFIVSNKIRVGVITDSEWIFYTTDFCLQHTEHGMACRYYMGTTFCSNFAWQKILSLVCRFQIMQIGLPCGYFGHRASTFCHSVWMANLKLIINNRICFLMNDYVCLIRTCLDCVVG